MQQAIYSNIHIKDRTSFQTNIHGNAHAMPGHGTGVLFKALGNESQDDAYEDDSCLQNEPQEPRFEKLRLTLSVAGNVVGGALLLSGMLMLPQLLVSLLSV